MACITADGRLTATAKNLLTVLMEEKSIEEIRQSFPRPTYILRSMLRELMEANLISEKGDKYYTTADGIAKMG